MKKYDPDSYDYEINIKENEHSVILSRIDPEAYRFYKEKAEEKDFKLIF